MKNVDIKLAKTFMKLKTPQELYPSNLKWSPDRRPFQAVDKALLLQGFAIVGTAFHDIINIRRAMFFMMTKNADKKREQMMMFSMDDMVPQNHMLRLIDKAINWNFIYDLVEEKYCPDNGRPSMDPVMLIKIPFIQYLYGIKSMRQTMKEIEVNVAYRWFLGLDMLDPIPHFSTFGKNYTRRFKDTDLFEQIFSNRQFQETYLKRLNF